MSRKVSSQVLRRAAGGFLACAIAVASCSSASDEPPLTASEGAAVSAGECLAEAKQIAGACLDPINAVGTVACTSCSQGVLAIVASEGSLSWEVAGACLMCQALTFPCKATVNQWLNDCSHSLPAPPFDPCLTAPKISPETKKTFAFYCGGGHLDGFDGRDSSKVGHLYECEGELTKTALVAEMICPSGTVCGPADAKHRSFGQLYDCVPPVVVPPHPSQDPCAKVPSADNGVYCGRTTEFGFNSAVASAGTLYTCTNGVTTKTVGCAGGCNVAAAGMSDSCVSADPCAKVSASNDGVYCGTSKQAGFNASQADPHTLYTCSGGSTSHKLGCGNGCVVAPVGASDSCLASSSSDPCAKVSSANNGVYCGVSTQAGFNPSKANFKALYTCTNGVTTHQTTCSNGCTLASSGHPDVCSGSTDPCAGVSAADNGVYCGASSQAGFNGSIAELLALYTCTNGRTTNKTTCGNGCFVAQAGSPDACSNSTDPCAHVTSNGVYCGTSTQASFNPGPADPNTLYTCKGSVTVAHRICPTSCFVAPPGAPDDCN